MFDVVRRFAQPLGIHLPEWEGRIIETNKGVVTLLSVTERAKQLFGEAGTQSVAGDIERKPDTPFLPGMEAFVPPSIKGSKRRKVSVSLSDEAVKSQRGALTLDRVHAAMLMQSSGRTNALRALLASEKERGPEFLRLANSLSALYPKGREEKRLVDAMLLAVPR